MAIQYFSTSPSPTSASISSKYALTLILKCGERGPVEPKLLQWGYLYLGFRKTKTRPGIGLGLAKVWQVLALVLQEYWSWSYFTNSVSGIT